MFEPIADGVLVQLFPVADPENQLTEDTDQFQNICNLYEMKLA